MASRTPAVTGRRHIDAGTLALTLLTLMAFASNSLLTRLALGAGEIDAATFTTLRLAAGAAALALIIRTRADARLRLRPSEWGGPIVLFAYAVPFSFAYLRIGAATGALVLFGVVQLTMIGWGVARGQRPTPSEWVGVGMASAGLVVLTLPSATRPDPFGLLLMAAAGVGWGVYSLAGRTSRDPVAVNARSFVWSCPPAILVNVLMRGSIVASSRGIGLALLCGAVTSALGYVIWYRALRGLSVTQAAAAQLSVPVIAAAGAVVMLGEHLNTRLVICGLAVLSGVALALASRAGQTRT
jgi:drug/metabolite transporter (DMT)-like permease